MSRIGKKIIPIPAGVTIALVGSELTVKGPKGTLTYTLVPEVTVVVEDSMLRVELLKPDAKGVAALWGLTRALINNMVTGVTAGFSKSLEINGVGFKVAQQGRKLVLNVGFSHPVEFALPEGVDASVEKNIITVTGRDRQLVGQVAAEIRAIKKPEPYKGKGIRYTDEVIRRKLGKVMKSAG
jgi:large subunit ribosomal protein L6